MTVSNQNPIADSLLTPADSVTFDLDDGGTTPSVITVTVAGAATEVAWSLAGGFQPGFSGSAVKVGDVYTITVRRSAGWDASPFTVFVDYTIGGVPSASSWGYELAVEQLYPDLMQPRNPVAQGSLIITDDGDAVSTVCGWLDVTGTGYTLTNLGNGKVRLTLTGGGGGGTDPDAIHDNVGFEISNITEKEVFDREDVLVGEDAYDFYTKRKAQAGVLSSMVGVWEYDSSDISESNPGVGLFTLNNATPGSATAIYLAQRPQNAALALSGIFSDFSVGMGFMIRKGSEFAILRSTSVTRNTVVWMSIGFEYVQVSDGFDINDGDRFSFEVLGLLSQSGAVNWATWQYDDSDQLPTAPPAGNFKTNNATPGSETAWYIADDSLEGSMTSLLSSLTNQNTIRITNNNEWAVFKIEGIINLTGYYIVTGDYIGTSPSFSYAAGNEVSFEFIDIGESLDPNAVHVNVPDEISTLPLVTAAAGDHILIEDVSDSNIKKRVLASDFVPGGIVAKAEDFTVGIPSSTQFKTNSSSLGSVNEFDISDSLSNGGSSLGTFLATIQPGGKVLVRQVPLVPGGGSAVYAIDTVSDELLYTKLSVTYESGGGTILAGTNYEFFVIPPAGGGGGGDPRDPNNNAETTTTITAGTTVSSGTNVTGTLVAYDDAADFLNLEISINGVRRTVGPDNTFDCYPAGTAANGDFACSFDIPHVAGSPSSIVIDKGGTGGAAAGGGISALLTNAFITPASPVLNTWYGWHAKGLSDNTNWGAVTFGTGATPTITRFTLGWVMPADGAITEVKFWLRPGAAATSPGVFELWKGSKTSGLSDLTLTKLGTTLTIPTVAFDQNMAVNATFASANTVAAGDTVYVLFRQGADTLNNCYISMSALFEAS